MFKNDCAAQLNKDTIISNSSLQKNGFNSFDNNNITTEDTILKQNLYLNITASPVSLTAKEKLRTGKEVLFYLLAIMLFLLALFKMFYTKYFNNIFRVFFNTSLRQNQLTDLLLQAKLPSLIFNIFFVISFGLYLWLLVNYYSLTTHLNNYIFASISILFIACLYFCKFISLKFIGWVCGISLIADQYIFVTFLINKIAGILFVPFIILMAFGKGPWLNNIIIFSFFVFGILFLLRYLRSYGLLQNQIKFNRFHFFVYLSALEIVPVLLIYKLFFKII